MLEGPRTSPPSGSSSSASITLRMSEKRDLRRRVAQLAELALELLAVLLGHEADVEDTSPARASSRRPSSSPSAATICSAASRWRRSSALSRPSSVRARLAARVPSWRAAWPAARLETFAVRESREVGIRSFAIRGRMAGPARAWALGSAPPLGRRGVWRWPGVPVAALAGLGGLRGRGVGVASSSSGRGGRRRLLLGSFASGRPAFFSTAEQARAAVAGDEPPNSASSEAVTTPAAMTKASAPVMSAIFSRGRGVLPALRRPNGSSSRTDGASSRRCSGSGSKPSGPSPRAPTRSGSRVRRPPAAARGGARAGAPGHARGDRRSRAGPACAAPRRPARRSPASSRSR